MKNRILKVTIVVIIMGIIAVASQNYDHSSYVRLLSPDKLRVRYYSDDLKKTDDGKIYLYSLKPYEYKIPKDAEPLLSKKLNKINVFDINFKEGYLYEKFVLAGYYEGDLEIIAGPRYITNPEMLAKTVPERKERPEFCTQPEGLANIPLLGPDAPEYAPVNVNTIQVLNPGFSIETIHPLAMFGVEDTHFVESPYRMLNSATDEGIKSIADELKWYAKNTKAQDFIIGNEVNERRWNYMSWVPWDKYMREYTNGFRVCYNAIKSVNPNARIYVCLSGNWNRDRNPSHPEFYRYIDSKDFLDEFERLISGEGNIDWSLSIHPYIVPPDYGMFWDYSRHPEGEYMKKQIRENLMFSFQNMGVVTDYMSQERFLNPSGKIRDMIISELGICRFQGDEAQAASICGSYAAFKMNPLITQYLYLNASGDGVDPRLFGIAKKALEAMGTEKEEEYMEWALSYIGIKSWDEVIENPDWFQ